MAVGVQRFSGTQDLRKFVPDIPASVDGGECETHVISGYGKRVGLAFPSIANAVRKVWLTYGENGELEHYADVRGDLVRRVVGPDAGPPRAGEPIRTATPEGRQTGIHITMRSNIALVENVGGDREPMRAVGSMKSLMTAENLGNPKAMIDMVTARCGS